MKKARKQEVDGLYLLLVSNNQLEFLSINKIID